MCTVEPATAQGLTLKEFLDRLVANLDFKAREVYASAAEVCGMVIQPGRGTGAAAHAGLPPQPLARAAPVEK